MKRRCCPLCGGLHNRLLYRRRFEKISAASILDGYRVVVCTRCGMGFADGIPRQKAFDAYYRRMSKYEYQDQDGRVPAYDRCRFRKAVGAMSRDIPSRQARILEIGCSTGALLSLLKRRGYPNVTGLDPSPRCARTAQKLYGLSVGTGTIAGLLKRKGRYDFLVVSHVLEHVCDPGDMLKKIYRILDKSGRVYVEVPDAERFAAYPDAPFQQFSVEHINFFSIRSLDRLMRASGFGRLHYRRDVHTIGHGSTIPVIGAVYEKQGRPGRPELSEGKDSVTEEGLREYVKKSQETRQRVSRKIDRLAETSSPVVVWGVGTHTLSLLKVTRLKKANIRAFVDSNPQYQGKRLIGRPVIKPSELASYPGPVLISSRVFQKEIYDQVRTMTKGRRAVISLYKL